MDWEAPWPETALRVLWKSASLDDHVLQCLVGPEKFHICNTTHRGKVITAKVEMATPLLKRLQALDKECDVRIGKTEFDTKPACLKVFNAYVHWGYA